MPNCAVLVNSFDGYSDAWPMMEHGLRKFWPDMPFELYWQCNHKQPPMGTPIECDVTTWAFMIREALIRLMFDGFEYFIFMHEDFLLVDRVDNARLTHYLNMMHDYLLGHIQLVPSWDVMKIGLEYNFEPTLTIVHAESDYRTSNQASIWRTTAYLNIVKRLEMQAYRSAWDFETHGSRLSKDITCLCISPWVDAELWPIRYAYRHVDGWDTEPIVRGHWTRAAAQYCKQEGIPFEFEVGGKVWKQSQK